MTVRLVVEVKTIPSLLYTYCLLVCFMTENELLQIQECSFMMHSLSYLDLTCPSVRSPSLFAVITLLILYHELNTKSLLKHSIVLNLLLDYHLHFYSSTVRFCPNESSIYNLNFVQAFHVFETHCP